MKNIGKIRIGGHLFAEPSDLVKLEAKENYTLIDFSDGRKLLVATTLGKLQERLRTFGFFRNSRGTMVNLQFVKTVNFTGKYYNILLENNENLPVSRRRSATLLKITEEHELNLSWAG
ncbi:MAG TPA: LytTR family DNA-binding domain-containing protein [Leadbetterella sp.]|nr:LytTR family DNA-binding domain-containing protein [Leadbetterella sp.]